MNASSHKTLPRSAALGIDIGRVVMCPAHDDGSPDTSFLQARDQDALSVPPAPHLFDVLPEIVRRFSGRVWLVSKAGPRIEALTRLWLDHHRFAAITGMRRDHVRFCRRRPDKRLHAVELGLTHFIDDRADVLGHLRGAVEHLYLFGAQTSPIPTWVTPVNDWQAACRALLGECDVLRGNALGEPDAVGRPVEHDAGEGHPPRVDP
jgi:hypothetical protein